MAKSKDTLKTASVLAFERKLDPSDALLYSAPWDQRDNSANWRPIELRVKSVRGTISNRLKTKDQDPTKLDSAIESPNLQTVHVATLPHDADTLVTRFTLRVLGGAGTPSACNSAEYQAKLQQAVTGYVQEQGFGELARRYAHNLANGRFLWRNRFGAEQIDLRIRHMEQGQSIKEWTFDALDLSLRDFDSGKESNDLVQLIADALAGKRFLLLEIIAYARIGTGQEVFPSQELILDRVKGGQSKTLYEVKGVAGIHSQKLGNAIRTIDTWYPKDDIENLGPIAVEPYGSVTTQGKAYRQPQQKLDFYSLLDGWIIKDKVPDTDQQHFVMATLVRGGVFGEADKA